MTIRFHDLYEKYAADVYRFAYWLCGDANDAQDLTSETFLRAWTSSSTIRTETVKAYLFAIVRNLHLRQRKQQAVLRDLPITLADSQPSPESLTENRAELDHVQRALKQISEPDRSAFIMQVLFKIPYREVARVLKISEGAAKVKVHRVRLKLAAQRKESDK